MSKETFTDEQRKALEANPYTKLTGSHYIRFTEAFWQVFGRNTEYVIDPEEVLADNFSYAVMYGEEGMDYKSPQMIRAICDYLRR